MTSNTCYTFRQLLAFPGRQTPLSTYLLVLPTYRYSAKTFGPRNARAARHESTMIEVAYHADGVKYASGRKGGGGLRNINQVIDVSSMQNIPGLERVLRYSRSLEASLARCSSSRCRYEWFKHCSRLGPIRAMHTESLIRPCRIFTPHVFSGH